jgi:hypothetical protein
MSAAILDQRRNPIGISGRSGATRGVLAANIATVTSTTPMQNRSELVTRSGLPLTILPLPTTSQNNHTVMARREVVPRAISSVSQTRVWNLLIDLVARSGRYKPNATSLQNDFIVKGEQHYWMHLAIERLTRAGDQ